MKTRFEFDIAQQVNPQSMPCDDVDIVAFTNSVRPTGPRGMKVVDGRHVDEPEVGPDRMIVWIVPSEDEHVVPRRVTAVLGHLGDIAVELDQPPGVLLRERSFGRVVLHGSHELFELRVVLDGDPWLRCRSRGRLLVRCAVARNREGRGIAERAAWNGGLRADGPIRLDYNPESPATYDFYAALFGEARLIQRLVGHVESLAR